MLPSVHFLHLSRDSGRDKERQMLVDGRQENRVGCGVLLMSLLIGFVEATVIDLG